MNTESAITLRIVKERSWIVKQLVEIRARKVIESANRRKAIETNPTTTRQRTINRLRLEHTRLFESNDPNKWLKMQTIRTKLIYNLNLEHDQNI